ncbi:hypothetical protein X732_30335 [Mesorhizobium sp. L2C066B000]|nr:hypothetical protein X732_30335 [Mesorhizobium sp. L2C066B000]
MSDFLERQRILYMPLHQPDHANELFEGAAVAHSKRHRLAMVTCTKSVRTQLTTNSPGQVLSVPKADHFSCKIERCELAGASCNGGMLDKEAIFGDQVRELFA